MSDLKLPRVRVSFLSSAEEEIFIDKFGDAPKDGYLYGRKNGVWVVIPDGMRGYVIRGTYDTMDELLTAHPAGDPGDAYAIGTSSDWELYIWSADTAGWASLGPMDTFSDAPEDGVLYGRKDGAWEPLEGGFEDAPENGNLYGRRDGAWAPVAAGAGGEANTYSTFEALVVDYGNVEVGSTVKTLGYFAVDDEGAATYEITDAAANSWDIEIGEGKYASIRNRDVVTYRMFGAVLDGVEDDGPAMRRAHAYADSVHTIDGTGKIPVYTCRVENHCGIIYKADQDAITFNSDIDLSGSVLLVNDTNAAWFGIYVWGDNDSLRWSYEPSPEMKATLLQDNHVINPTVTDGVLPGNAVIRYEETPYAARDDAGYSYTVGRKELMVHDMDGLCSSPFTDDWTRAGGQEISVLVSDLVNGGYKTETFYTTFSTSYNYAHPKHGLFVGCDVQLDITANSYSCVVWVKRHNCEIRDFAFRPKSDQLHNTKYKNTMIYLWDSYNVKVSGLQGFNSAGKKIGTSKATSGYILRLTNCSDVHVSDCRLQGYWGATAMDSVKNIHFDRCHINRLDIHDYFANLWANECVFYNSAIQIGYGRGIACFTNSRFHLNPSPGDSYPGSYICAFNMSYGRIFEGTVRVENCQVYGRNLPANEFNLFKAEFSPDATSITPHFKFPEIIATNVQVYSADPSAHYSYFKITGTRRGTTSGVRPSHVKDVSGDGTVRWRFFGRSVEWGDTVTSISVGQILRVMDTFLDNEDPPKTQFYNKRYYRCTQAGTLSFGGDKPTDTSGNPITIGTARLVYVGPDVMWKSRHAYSVGDACAVSHSNWFPMELYICEQAGTSNGFFPVHTSGTVIDGINDAINEPDAVWWTYVGTKASWCTDWTAGMTVTNGQRILVENRLYEVTQAGALPSLPPYITMWFGVHDWGTARLKFIGKQWGPKEWFPKDSFCEAHGNIYRVANHDGSTSGILPVRGKEYCIDGDVVWKHVSGSNTNPGQTGSDTWQAQHAYDIGDTVIANANTYECEFDGKMVLPHKSVFKNIVTNMSNGQVFWFYAGTDIPTRAGDKPWTIIAQDCEGIARVAKFPVGMTKYFGNADNINPTAVLATTGTGGGGEGVEEAPADGKLYGRKSGSWEEVPGAVEDGIGEAPEDSKLYARMDGNWAEVPAPGIGDALSDDKLYARKNGAWEEVPAASMGEVEVADVRGLAEALAGKMPKTATALTAANDLNTDATTAGYYVTVWNTAHNPSNTACLVMTIPGANANAAFSQLAVALSQNKLYFRTSAWMDDVLTFNAWIELTATGSGTGDMLRSTYDTDTDGKVNAAEQADEAGSVRYIDLSTAPSDGDTLVYDEASETFKPGPASSGSGLPSGGTAGQILAKATNADFDVNWQDPPSGGTGITSDSTRDGVRVLLDVARHYSAGGTGAMKLALGSAISTDIFLQGEIVGYNHATKTPWRCEFGGWAGAGSWGGFSAVTYPNCPFTSVRPAHDGTSLCLLLGTTSTSWSYPVISVPRVQVAYGGMASVPAQWNISLVASEAGITVGTTTSMKTISAT